ncbi:hypothetical protein [Nocardioides convexus]|uniref:hypothetical protein n=1 Tax=Nocardioides convexus TaxID=2712224 RepID=UPI00241819FB|nr:hypothetical protein [Nocardioides convexus]
MALIPVVGAFFSLAERSRVGTTILLLAVATVAGLELAPVGHLGRHPWLRRLSTGWGRALVFVYGLFAVAATGRSAVQTRRGRRQSCRTGSPWSPR